MKAKRANPYHYSPIVSQQKVYKLPLKLRASKPKKERYFSPTLALFTLTGCAIILFSISAIEGLWKWIGVWVGVSLFAPLVSKSFFANRR